VAVLPTEVGFSGESEFVLSLQGTWDYLSLHGSWDLTPAVLTYGKFFSKPKDFPMGITCDLILKAGSFLSGDFSVRIHETTTKGALVGLDPKTGIGELTLLTNKFALKGWETLLTPFAGYEISGFAKILTHWKGVLNEINKTDKMLNLTLEDAALVSSTGRGIRGVKALLDMSSLSLRLKDTSFEIGGSPVQVEAEIYNLRENPQGGVQITSARLDPFALLDNLKALTPLFPLQGSPGYPNLEKARARLAKMEKTLQRFFPNALVLEEVWLDLKVGPGKLALENLSFQALEGNFRLRGQTEWPSEKPNFWLEAELDKMSLARYFEGIGRPEKILEGNLFFKGRFQGQGLKSDEISENLTGEGTLAIANGDWRSLDLMGPLGKLDVFQRGGATPPLLPAMPSTPFHDLKAGWRFGKGKFDTDDFLLNSEYLWVEGRGNLTLEGIFNSRLEVYLSKPLTAQVLDSWGMREKQEGRQLGPLPFLLLGKFSQAEVRADDQRMKTFLEAVRARKFRKILHKPFKS
jgi:hypothetical protein